MASFSETYSPVQLVTPERAAAIEAAEQLISKLDTLLAYSPHNPSYLTSEAYLRPKAILDQERLRLLSGLTDEILTNVNFDHEGHDINALLGAGNMFTAYDIAYAGLKDTVIAQFDGCDRKAPPEVVRTCGVNVIGATLVRMHYMAELAKRSPDIQARYGSQPLGATHEQNLISALRRTSHLEQHTLYAHERPTSTSDIAA